VIFCQVSRCHLARIQSLQDPSSESRPPDPRRHERKKTLPAAKITTAQGTEPDADAMPDARARLRS